MVGGWHRSQSLATASLWFAFLGGMSNIWSSWFLPWFLPSAIANAQSAFFLSTAGVVGMTVSLIGAGLGRQSEAEAAKTRLVDLNRLGALLVCAGGALGLIGSPGSSGFFFPWLSLVSFAVVLLLGVALLRTGPESRIFAAIALYFALAGSGVFIAFGLPILFRYGWGYHWFLFVGPAATMITAVGAILRLRRGR